jgi:dienelactone hydrolase
MITRAVPNVYPTMRRLALAALVCILCAGRAAGAGWQYIGIPLTQPDGTMVHLVALAMVPDGTGPFPLAVISHGSPRDAAVRARMAPGTYQGVGQWLADQGYAVVIPMRRGYGQSQGQYLEGSGSCGSPDYIRSGLVSAQDIAGVIDLMRGQSFVDAKRIVLVGHSAGGWASLAAASQNPPGVVAVVVFAPGRGSTAPDEVCAPAALVGATAQLGRTDHVPTLWIASENDHFFGPALARGMFDAFHAASPAPAQFVAMPSCGRDGHELVLRCPDDWHATVAAFLRQTAGGR